MNQIGFRKYRSLKRIGKKIMELNFICWIIKGERKSDNFALKIVLEFKISYFL